MLNQPSANIKMTNVATIRYKINNRHFQIACYRNKALNWRNGVEEDLSEVLQMEQIYENVSHGTLAKKADLNKFFANKTKKQIIEVILQRGELQVSDKQRQAQQSNITADIIKVIVEKCVHPVTKRKFTFENIRQALKDIHFAVKTDQPAKKQALQCIKLLQKRYKIARGQMKVRISFPKQKQQVIMATLKQLQIEQPTSTDEKGNTISKVYDIEPNKYRDLNQMCKQQDGTTVEVLVNVVVNTEYKDLESEQSGALQLLDQFKEKGSLNEQEEKTQKINLTKQMDKMTFKDEKKTEQKVIKCSTCGQHAQFTTTQDHRNHFKTDWHVFNIKRKSKGQSTMSEEDYKVQIFNKNYE